MARILVLGGGGREHALVWSFAGEAAGHTLFCAPGNAGTAALATNLSIDINDHPAVAGAAREHAIDLTVVGPEGPLADGIVDYFKDEGLTIFGPVQAAARLESSKLFARDFMADAGIPHPDYTACGTIGEAREAAVGYGFPVVLKADGLAAGKGVFICETTDELEAALKRFYIEDAFGSAGRMVSVEQCLAGTEMSVFALCDGENVTVLGTAQDFKRAYDGDAGPNTGGMGSIAPSRLATDALMERVRREILLPTLASMRKRGNPYTGFLYAGLMLVEGDPYVIEFNVRMGDPETQALLPLLDQPLYPLLAQALAGELPEKVTLKSGAATCVVLAAEGYPGSYEKGLPIGGLDGLPESVGIFHAGTSQNGSHLVNSGGRVLGLVATGGNHAAAAAIVYAAIDKIDFPGSFYRHDIGTR